MEDFNVLKELFLPKFLIESAAGKIVLEEKEPSAKLKSIVLRGLPQTAFALKLDDGELGYFLNHENGQRRCCDYILIIFKDKKRLLFFVELKSARWKQKHVVQQLRGGNCVISYCESVLSQFQNRHDFFSDFERRYFSFHQPVSIAKKPTRPKLGNYSVNTADQVHRFPFPKSSGSEIHLRHILG